MTRVLIALLFASALIPRLAVADDAPTTAEQLYNDGQAAFDAKRYDDALAAWQKSYELSREPALLFNLAQAYRLRGQEGDCAKAATTYRKFIAQDPLSTQRQIAESFASDSEKCAAAESSKAATTTATVPAPTDSGGSGRGRPGRTKRIAGITLAGGGVLLVATGLYFGHKASALGEEVTEACADGCDWAVFGPKDADGRSAQRKQYIVGGLGVAALLGGAVLYWLGSREHAPSPIAIVSHRDGAGIAWSGAW